jgi:hypothetical protein
VRAAEPEGLALRASPDHVSALDVLGIVRDPAPGGSVLRRRDAAVRDALEGLMLRGLISPLARYRAS